MKSIKYILSIVIMLSLTDAFAQPASPTWNQVTGAVCEGTTRRFSVNPVSGATSYSIYPSGPVQITQVDARTVDATFPEDFAGGVAMNARACNASGCSDPITVNITLFERVEEPVFTVSSSIVTPGASNVQYTIDINAGSPIVWTLPTGATKVSGSSDSKTIYVDFDGSFTSGYITVFGVSGPCGAGPTAELLVTAESTTPLTPSADQNYIISRSLRQAIQDENNIPNSPSVASMTVKYFDGLGRPLQDVVYQTSPDKKDIVQAYEYDDYGRESMRYLPYTDRNSANGSFRSNAIRVSGAYSGSEHYNFYRDAGGYSNPDVANDNAPYAQIEFEPSPLNRVLEQGAPGVDWQPNASSSVHTDHTIETSYETNAAGEVWLWKYEEGNYPYFGRITAESSSETHYSANELYVTKTLDENYDPADDNYMKEYTDKQGNLVLKKVRSDASTILNTCYVYDDFGNLRAVIPPEGFEYLQDNNIRTPGYDFLSKWCFLYTYDHRQRMIGKKVPGADWVYMVYDSRDRLILTQDGNQRGTTVENVSGSKTVDIYENKSYKLQSSSSSVTLSPGFSYSAFGDDMFFVSSTDLSGGDGGKWLFTQYDELNRPVMTGEVTLSATYESLLSSYGSQSSSMAYEGNTSTDIYGYSPTGYPAIPSTSSVFTVTYYDTYDFKSFRSLASVYNFTTDGILNANDLFSDEAVIGQVTGGITKSFGGGEYDYVNYYDKKMRLIQTAFKHHGGEVDRTTQKYNFDNSVAVVKRKHEAHGENSKTVVETYSYDHAGRLLSVDHSVGGVSVPMVANEYNEIGELTLKTLHNGVQDVNFDYNIRGWMTKINGGTALSGSDKFGLELIYNELNSGLNNEQTYNGNISAMIWRNAGENNGEAYTYGYDNLNRLKSAYYHAKGTSWSAASATRKFNVKDINYDLNGNILSLTRYGAVDNDQIDQLVYGYDQGGNQLTKVDDNAIGGAGLGFEDGTNGGDDYAYDSNGNLVKDLNKDITGISYNILNLPETITFSDGDYIQYLYDATGTKLIKKVKEGTAITYTSYIDNFQYERPPGGEYDLKYIFTSEGRIVDPDGAKEYQYMLKDHLGNTRALVSQTGTVESFTEYYPFGMTYSMAIDQTVGDNKYLFNGIELQNELGLDLYMTLFRLYDPALGRFTSIDPLADFFPGISPYSFGFDNPILFGDPDGLAPMWWLKLRAKIKQAVYNVTGRSNQHAVIHGKNKGMPVEIGAKTAGKSKSNKSPNNAQNPNFIDDRKDIDYAEPRLSLENNQPNSYLRPQKVPEPEFAMIDGEPVTPGRNIDYTGTIFGTSSFNLVNKSKTSRDLNPVAESLKKDQRLAITIQIHTNLTLNDENGNTRFIDLAQTLSVEGLLNQRGIAIQKALMNLGVDPKQMVYMYVPNSSLGNRIRIKFRENK